MLCMSEELNVEQEEIKKDDVATGSSDETVNTDKDDSQTQERIPYDRFKQKVDEANALKAELDEIKQAQADAKRKELEETEQYKELYEQAKAEAEAIRQQALAVQKNTALTLAGYNEEQAQTLGKLVEGESAEEIVESIYKLRAKIPNAVD